MKIDKAKEISDQVTKTLESIVADIGHEIRTPLTIINLTADLLKRTLDNPTATANCDKIKAATRHANHIISTLLVKLHYLANKQPTDVAEYSMVATINEALAVYPYKTNQQTLINWDQHAPDFYYYGSNILIKHVLFNLLKNGLRAIQEASNGDINISLRTSNQTNDLIFNDTGCGMQATAKPGLGLRFCNAVMQACGGEITYSSEANTYTQFILHFPKKLPCKK